MLAAGGVAAIGVGIFAFKSGAGASSAGLPLSISATASSTATNIAIVSRSPRPITIRRITANDRSGVYGCDFNPALNGKSDEFGYSSADFHPRKLAEGDEIDLTVWNASNCGDRVVKLTVTTDMGSADYPIH
ncbi:MAG TPA: hypothetical protein VIM56_11255 [Rhizomicrobium sp.]